MPDNNATVTAKNVGAENGLSKLIPGVADLLGPWGGLAMAGVGIANQLISAPSEQRRREIEVEQALARNRKQSATLDTQLMSTEANRRAKAEALQQGMSAATGMAANIGAGQAAASGLGGDVTSAQVAGVKAAPQVAAAAAPYAQGLAGTWSEKAQEQQGLNQQIMANNQQRADIAYNYTDYITNQGTDWLTAGVSGLNAFANIDGLLGGGDKKASTGTPDNTQSGLPGPAAAPAPPQAYRPPLAGPRRRTP